MKRYSSGSSGFLSCFAGVGDLIWKRKIPQLTAALLNAKDLQAQLAFRAVRVPYSAQVLCIIICAAKLTASRLLSLY